MNVEHNRQASRRMRATWLAFGLSLLALMAGAALGAPNALTSVLAPAAAPPTLISYQGFVKVGGNAYTGTGYFKFAVMDAASGNGTTNYWANDGAASGEPAALVSLAVTGGLFDVMLGDTSLAGMTQAITQNSFNQTNTYLRVWFSQTAAGPFQALDPNQRIGSAAYALHAARAEVATDAENLDGLDSTAFAPAGIVPSGAVMFFNLSACPAGWTELTAAQGRVIVGLPAGGTLNGTVGSAFSDLENRTHSHAINPPATTSSAAGGHSHIIDPPATSTSSSGGGTTSGVTNYTIYNVAPQSGGLSVYGPHEHYLPSHSHVVDVGSFASSYQSDHTHTTDIASFDSGTTGGLVPYLQLLACQRN